MWMRCAINVLYLDENKRVVHLEENVRPWRMTPMHFDAATVIEVRSPAAMFRGTCVGDTLDIVGFDDEGQHSLP